MMPRAPHSGPRTARRLTLLIGLSAVSASFLLQPRDVAATPPGASQVATAASAPPQDAGSAQTATSTTPPSTNVTIVFATTPGVTATVTWGKKSLGKIKPGKPLVVVRPRDSGPLDVKVHSPGYLSVQTRAHTFSDNRVQVKLTPVEKKSELLGYRAPLDAGVEPEVAAELSAIADSDAGIAPVPGTFQVVPPAGPTQSPLLEP